MDIIKNLNDYNLDEQERRFIALLRSEFLFEKTCSEEITNPKFLVEYNKSISEIFPYSSAMPGNQTSRIRYKKADNL